MTLPIDVYRRAPHPGRMIFKALVLTFDKQIGFAELAIKRYHRMWPDLPFEFIVPYQSAASVPVFLASSESVRLVRSASDIRSTMRTLLEAVHGETWVYWLIDDRYPVQVMGPERLNRVARAVGSGEARDASAVRMIRWRETLTCQSRRLDGESFSVQSPGEFTGFWLHQFMRPELLRQVFFAPGLPAHYTIRDVQNAWVAPGTFEASRSVWVPENSMIHFAEPCKKGRLLSAAHRDLEAEGCAIPEYETIEAENIYTDTTRSRR